MKSTILSPGGFRATCFTVFAEETKFRKIYHWNKLNYRKKYRCTCSFKFFLHIFIYFVGAHVSWHACGCQGTTCRNPFFPATIRVPGIKLECQAWQQALLPTKSSYQPPCVVFKCNLWNELFVNYMYVLSGYCTLWAVCWLLQRRRIQQVHAFLHICDGLFICGKG